MGKSSASRLAARGQIEEAVHGRALARLAATYAWASPDYIANHMTVPQLHAFLQQINYVQEQASKPFVMLLLEGLFEALKKSPILGGRR